MTSKELIDILQKIDPEGNTIVTTTAGAISAVNFLYGGYDGSYEYYDGDDFFERNFVLSKRGNKIRIDVDSLSDFLSTAETVEELEEMKQRIIVHDPDSVKLQYVEEIVENTKEQIIAFLYLKKKYYENNS